MKILFFLFGLCCMTNGCSNNCGCNSYSINVASKCPSDFSKHTYKLLTEKVDFHRAYFRCKQLEMDLASITSGEEEADLINYLNSITVKITDGPYNGFWLSGTYLGGNGEFNWLSNGQPVIYRDFVSGQPDNAGGVEGCIEIFKNKNTYGWNDINCSQALGYICQSRKIYH